MDVQLLTSLVQGKPAAVDRDGKLLRKGQLTRNAVLEQAFNDATRNGLNTLRFNTLAEQLHMSKTGVFAAFGSMLALKLAVLQLYRERFEHSVLFHSYLSPAGLPRLTSLFRYWTKHISSRHGARCFYIRGSYEYDDQPGPVKDRIVQDILAWRQTLEDYVLEAVEAGHLRPDTDVKQFVHELYALILILDHDLRLTDDRACIERTQQAFDRLTTAHCSSN